MLKFVLSGLQYYNIQRSLKETRCLPSSSPSSYKPTMEGEEEEEQKQQHPPIGEESQIPATDEGSPPASVETEKTDDKEAASTQPPETEQQTVDQITESMEEEEKETQEVQLPSDDDDDEKSPAQPPEAATAAAAAEQQVQTDGTSDSVVSPSVKKHMGKRLSTSAKAELSIPVARVHRAMKEDLDGFRVSLESAIFLAGVIETFTTCLIEQLAKYAEGLNKTRVSLRDLVDSLKERPDIKIILPAHFFMSCVACSQNRTTSTNPLVSRKLEKLKRKINTKKKKESSVETSSRKKQKT